jgi:SPP1 family predicted phage head-tail adaptor
MAFAQIQWPSTGEMTRRVVIRKWSDEPNLAFGVTPTFDAGVARWAKVEPIHGLAYWAGKQIGDETTHVFWIRYGFGSQQGNITGEHVIEWKGQRYRVLTATNIGDAQIYTKIEAKELGAL